MTTFGGVVDHYILVDREPVACPDWNEWADWMYHSKKELEDGHHAGNCRVGWDKVGEAEVSTVFLGIDHRLSWPPREDEPPILFETMTFGGKNDQDTDRYCTWAEAEAGHAAAVERAKAVLA